MPLYAHLTTKSFPIRIHWFWLPIVLLISYLLGESHYHQFWPDTSIWIPRLAGFMSAIGIIASLIIHELGHAFMTQAVGGTVKTVTVNVFGGWTNFEQEIPTPQGAQRVALAGPAASLTLAGICALFSTHPVGAYLMHINLLIGLCNLIPVFPLDGASLIRALFWQRTHSYAQATWTTARLSQLIAFACLLIGLTGIIANLQTLWITLGAVIALVFSQEAIRGVSGWQQLTNQPIHPWLIPLSHLPILTPQDTEAQAQHVTQQYGYSQLLIQETPTIYHQLSTPDITKTHSTITPYLQPLALMNPPTLLAAFDHYLTTGQTAMWIGEGTQPEGLLLRTTVDRLRQTAS